MRTSNRFQLQRQKTLVVAGLVNLALEHLVQLTGLRGR